MDGPYDQTRLNRVGDYYLYGGVPDPTVEPTAGPYGALYIRVARDGTTPTALYFKCDNGKTTNWKLIPTKFEINGQPVTAEPLNLDFTGAGVTVTPVGDGTYTIDIPGGGGGGNPISVELDDSEVVSVLQTLNFEGSGVQSVVDEGSGKATVTINAGGGGGNPIDVQDDDVSVVNPLSILNFGDQLTVTDDGGGKATIGLNLASFNEKFFRVQPQILRADGNASKTNFKDTNTASLSSGGTSSFLWTVYLINYVAGNDININLDFLADGTGGPNRNVDTEITAELFQIGDDIDTLVPISKADLYTVPSTDGIAYRRSFVITAAELGNPVSGDYFMKFTYSRFANSPQDNFNKNLYAYLGRITWG